MERFQITRGNADSCGIPYEELVRENSTSYVQVPFGDDVKKKKSWLTPSSSI